MPGNQIEGRRRPKTDKVVYMSETTMVKIPKKMKEEVLRKVKAVTGFTPIFEEFVHTAIMHEVAKYEPKKAGLRPTGSEGR